jgi:hypothetical protein
LALRNNLSVYADSKALCDLTRVLDDRTAGSASAIDML